MIYVRLSHTRFLLVEDTFTLSVKTLDIGKKPTVKHITIFKLDDKEVCINKDKTFSSLNDLIDYYKGKAISIFFISQKSLDQCKIKISHNISLGKENSSFDQVKEN